MKHFVIVISIMLSLLNVSMLLANQDAVLNSKAFTVNSSSNQTELTFKLPSYKINQFSENNQNFTKIQIADASFTIDEGKPELPYYTVTFAVPVNSSPVLLNENVQKSNSLNNLVIYPAQAVDAEDKSYKFNTEFYNNDVRYPAKNSVVSEMQTLRDFNIVSVNVYPFIYNAKEKELKVNSEIKIVIAHNSKSAANYQINSTISREFEPLYRSFIANYDQIRSDYPVYQQPRILIIHPNSTDANFTTTLNNLVNWKRQKGFVVNLANTSSTQAGSSQSSIKNYIQAQYNDENLRPDYVMLIGDVSGTFGIPTTSTTYAPTCPSGAGDSPYTFLAGNDFLGDVMIGRLSISSVSDFQTMVGKVLLYEKNPTIQGTDWLKNNVLVGDPSSSGQSCISMSKYIKETILNYEPNSTFTEIYTGSAATQMQNAASQGALFFTYRGYIGMSGFTESNVSALTNDKKLFASLFITCNTGSFDNSSMIETITRFGTPSAPKGAVIAVGMSTSHTLTPYNNLLLGSMIHAHYVDEVGSAGGFSLFARINAIQTYGGDIIDYSKTLGHWMNLMGDPSINIYRAIPKIFNVQHNASISIGTNFLTVAVKDQSNNPVKNAWVSLSSADYVNLAFLVTDESGIVTLPISQPVTGNLFLTVSNQDYKAYIATITSDTNTIIGMENYTISDTPDGNNNQQVNPGETIKYSMTIKNNIVSDFSNLSVLLRTSNPHVTIIDSTATINSISAGSTVSLTDEFKYSVDADYPANEPLNFTVLVSSSTQYWASVIFENVKTADLDVMSMNVINTNQVIELGTPTQIKFTIKNNGSIPVQNVTAQLKTKSLFLQVSDSLAVLGTINAGSSVDNQNDTFTVTALSGIFPGVKLKAEITFTNTLGYSETEEFLIPVGSITSHDPVPPDAYGYVIYDVTDIAYGDAPVYDWTEISTLGTNHPITDSGENSDQIFNITVPFSFKMYGESYSNLTVSSNGWAAAVPTEQTDFRPLTLPNAIAPRSIIAPYFTDLAKSGTDGSIYTYYDQENHCFIIQWNHMHLVKHSYSYDVTSSFVTFQAIIYDPAFLATALGDSPIKFQYKDFHAGFANDDAERPNNHFTTGIQDYSAQRGLTYVFNNTYSPGAATLANNTALFITHPFFLNEAPYIMSSASVIHDQNGNNIIESGETINIGLPLVNVGLMAATNVHATLSTVDPYITITNAQADYNNINPSSSASNLNYFTINVLPSCPNDHIVNVSAHIVADQGDWNRSFNFNVKKANLAYRSYLINDTNGNANGILEAGETAKLIINLNNPTQLPVNNVITSIVSSNPNITINDNSSFTGVMQANTNYQNVFEVTLSSTITEQTSIPVQVTVASDNAPELVFQLQLGVNQSGALLQEAFNSFVPQGWIIQYFSSNWSLSQTAEAGGTAPEMKFSGYAVQSAYTRLVSCTMDATDISSIVLSYRQKLTVLQPGTVVGVATRHAYGSWNVVWSETVSESISPELKNIPINNEDLGHTDFQVCWYVDGVFANIQDWYLDDVTIQTNVGNTAFLSGLVQIDDPAYNVKNITVKAGDYAVTPDSTGAYQLFLIPGNYPFITANTPFAISNSVNNVQLVSGQIMENVNFNLNYYMNPRNLHFDMNADTHLLNLLWTYNLPANSPHTFAQFKVYKQVNSTDFELVESTTQTNYSETLSTEDIYRYYVVAEYTSGLSDSSNVVYIDPNITSNDPNPPTPVKFALNQNYPNPFNPITNISFSIPEDSKVNLNIYNVKGQLVKSLKNEKMYKGSHIIQWNGLNQNGRSVGSGIYFIKLDTEKNHSVKKALLLK